MSIYAKIQWVDLQACLSQGHASIIKHGGYNIHECFFVQIWIKSVN